MQYGVCADPDSASVLADAGFDFIELNVQKHLKPLATEPVFATELARIRDAALPALAANSFVPGSLKITGPSVDRSALEDYAVTAFARAEAVGVKTIVFGSGGARQIPDGFDREQAWSQLVWFGRMIGPPAQVHGVTVVVEPLNTTRGECNVLTSIGEGARYVREVDHPSVRLLADAYHWGLDGDSFDALVENAPLLCHIHVATVNSRVPPGFEPCDFSRFFHALTLGGYDGTISIEARWDDMAMQAGAAYRTLRELVIA